MTYTFFLFLLDRQVPAPRSSESVLDCLKVIITAIICLASVTDCWTVQRFGVRRKAGRESRGALGRCLSVKQEKKALYIYI
jgi:hypothetical protein